MRSRPGTVAVLLVTLLSPLFPLDPTVDEGYRRVASTSTLELYFDEQKLGFLVVDRRDGTLWHSSPVLSGADAGLSPTWRQALASPFQVSFTDRTRGIGSLLDLSKPRIASSDDLRKLEQTNELAVDELPDGIRLRYRVTRRVASNAVIGWGGSQTQEGTLGFSVVFRIVDDYLEVSVPETEILENGDFSLASIDVLPYLGANPDSRDGALLIPDGVGALLPYRESRGTPVSVSLPVWGEERFPFPHARTPVTGALPRELYFLLGEYTLTPATASAGVFGMLRRGAGFLGIVTDGAEEAQVEAALSGFVMGYNRVGTEFWFRRPYTQHLSRSMNVTKLGDTRIPGDRTVRYVFVPRPEAGYVALARRYREYLVHEGGLDSVSGAPSLPIHLFCGIRKRELLSSRLVSMTSFEQASRIVESLASAGVHGATIILEGWAEGGFDGSLPAKVSPERRFGGMKGLRDLVGRARGTGMRLYLDLDYLTTIRGNRGFSMRSVVRDANRLPVTNNEGMYVLPPSVAYERYAAREIPLLAAIGVDGLSFRHLGKIVLSDRGEQHFHERGRAIEEWSRILGLARERGLGVMVEGANSYVYGMADSIYEAPEGSSLRIYGSTAVPFFPIALHGLVSYSGWPLNLSGTRREDMLRMIEYGSLPRFELTWEDAVLLKDTAYSGLFASRFEHWIDLVKEAYSIFVEELGYLHGVPIANHAVDGPGHARTLYEDGSTVLVNYTDRPWQVDGREVAASGYLLLKPMRGEP